MLFLFDISVVKHEEAAEVSQPGEDSCSFVVF